MVWQKKKYKRQSKEKTETWSNIFSPSSRNTFTHVTSLWQNRFITITISVSPLDLSVPFPITLKTNPSYSNSFMVTTFNSRCKTSIIYWLERRNVPDCVTLTGLSTTFRGHTCGNSPFEVSWQQRSSGWLTRLALNVLDCLITGFNIELLNAVFGKSVESVGALPFPFNCQEAICD